MAATEQPAHQDVCLSVSIDSLLAQRFAAWHDGRGAHRSDGQWHGNRPGRRRGTGSDFDDLRPYTPGDDPRHIDWKTSARTHRLHTRLYRQEQEHRLTLLVDLRRSLYTGTRVLRAAHACHLGARLLWLGIDAGCRLSVTCIRDEGLQSGPGGVGHGSAIDACVFLASQFANAEASRRQVSAAFTDSRRRVPAACTLAQATRQLTDQDRRHGKLIWISAFDDTGSHFESAMQALSQASHQAAIHLDDEMLDKGLPAGNYTYYRQSAVTDNDISSSLSPVQTCALSARQAGQLRRQLERVRQQREACFARLDIPLLSTRQGMQRIMQTLHETGHLP